MVILDEADQLEDSGLLYDLKQLRGVDLVLIANDENYLFVGMDDRVQSRLSTCERVRFNRYSTGELTAILDDRVHWGLAEDAITDEGIHRIADAAAGDARTAIGILRNAARTAEQDGHDNIATDTIDSVIPTAKTELKQADLERLTPDQQKLYELIKAAGEISPGDLYEQYLDAVDEPKSKRMVRNYIEKMQHYKLIEASGQARARIFRVI